jgi:hypothetical protein
MTDAPSFVTPPADQNVVPPQEPQIPVTAVENETVVPPTPAPQQPAADQSQPLQQPQPPQQPQTNALPPIDDYAPKPETLVLEWQAASRPFKKRNKQFYVTVALIVFLVSAILLVASQFLLVATVIATAFFAYVLYSVPPEQITNQITTYGIRTDGVLYYWEELGRFWFSSKFGQRIVELETSRFPNRLTMVLGTVEEAELTELFSTVLLNERPVLTAFERAAQWLQRNIPLDTEA